MLVVNQSGPSEKRATISRLSTSSTELRLKQIELLKEQAEEATDMAVQDVEVKDVTVQGVQPKGVDVDVDAATTRGR